MLEKPSQNGPEHSEPPTDMAALLEGIGIPSETEFVPFSWYDVAALAERWVGDLDTTWIGLSRMTTMAEGDMYRLLARTLEFLSQLYQLKGTHPGLADCANQAMKNLRRGVLEELP